jgi:hypothetical protein
MHVRSILKLLSSSINACSVYIEMHIVHQFIGESREIGSIHSYSLDFHCIRTLLCISIIMLPVCCLAGSSRMITYVV